MNESKIYFAGEPNAGLHPKVLDRMARATGLMDASYREDKETSEMLESFDKLFGQKVTALLFTSGTAANVAGLAQITKPYHSIICPASGHINVYEAGGPTRFSGCSIVPLPTKDGKISPDQIEEVLARKTAENIYSQPRVVFISQPTEYGTIWTVGELKELASFCKNNRLYLFMDGSRISNAVQKLGVDIKEITTGVDVVTWGGIKNGGLADALVFINPELTHEVEFVYKQLGQDVAHSRVYAAAVNALLENDLWLENAKIANDAATRLLNKIKDSPKIKIVLPVETNMIWSVIPKEKGQELTNKFVYYLERNDLDLTEYKNIPFFTRIVTSWATLEKDVDLFAEKLQE